MRAGFVANEDKMIAAGKEAMVKQDPTLNAAFVEEWGKRMKQTLDPNEFVAMAAHVWESHFTEAELQVLAQGAKDRAAGKQLTLSPELKEKLTANIVAIQSEMTGGFSQIGSRVGGQIGMDLQKEHPEWFKASPPAGAKP
ncbi:hypothetical protein SAMN05421819_0805 [Bryocella elongata]|uniref:Uncharacterized protein n=1 Tax=Bryocella elongata TaxID=863522 RepID=A0A1H5TZS6_9BACT|nr:hypothetical protein [Bryocella elongata]SEF68240.1 hypothetical protein SAMN05421819_0805 [Bryocella elongata]